MNKKFSTLFAGGLLVSAMAVAQGTIDPASLQRVTTFASGKTYLVVQDVNKDGVIDATDALLGVTADRDGNLTYANVCNTFTNATAEESAYVWKVSEVTGVAGTYHYSFYNAEAGAYLAFDANGQLVVKADDAQPDKSKVYFAIDANAATSKFNCAGSSLLSIWQGGANALDLLASTPLNGDMEKFILCEYAAAGLTDASVLNSEMGGAGFAFEFKDDSKVEQNIFKDQVLKAFYVAGFNAISGNTDYTVPAGMYFATEYPASLASKDVISGNTAFDDFKECTFIAVDPTANKDIHQAPRANGLGFALTTVSGADMNFYTVASTDATYNANQTSSDDEVSVYNACFTVTEKDPMRNAGAYVLSVSPRVQTDATKTAHAQKSVEVGVIKDQNVSYLMTVAATAGQALTAGAGTKYDVTELLSIEGPSIYTIQFVSGNEDETSDDTKEYGLYLGGQKNTFIATPNGRAEDPLYQFVITAVDADKNTVTFTNRQTSASFTVSLFELEDDNTYTVQGTTTNFKYVEVDANGDYSLSSNKGLAGTKVLLTKIESVDKYATFLNHEDPASTVTIEFATRADADERLYLAAEYKNNKYTNKLIASEDEVSQWFLNKANRESIANAYVYLKNDKVVTSTLVKDSVVYFTYTMTQAIDENAKDIQNLNRLGLGGQEFIIKENADGSVSIIEDTKLRNSSDVYTYNKETAPFANGTDYYDWVSAANTAVKTFIVGEPAALSLEAKTQWVSMESVQGGFINANADNDAVIAIKEVAEEALTLRLDTTDSEEAIPYFYISKVGANADQRLYLYNAEDSTDVALSSTAQNKYTFGQNKVKLIFKEGALIGSDTIATMVNGKLANVAAKANVLNGTLRGIENFKYQIVKSDLASDDYLIRQNGKYVCNVNGMLTVDANRKGALHVTIEEVASPTSNESVAASEVSVVAVNGAIIVKGAAGKVVTVANILGQTIANQVAASDNVTIAAPAGIAVVTVDGEATKVVVK